MELLLTNCKLFFECIREAFITSKLQNAGTVNFFHSSESNYMNEKKPVKKPHRKGVGDYEENSHFTCNDDAADCRINIRRIDQ